MEILVHADGDEAGAAIAARVLARPAARPWRVVDPTAGVHEEALLDELLEDLRVAALGIEPGSAERFLARLGDILPAVEQNANPELALDVLLLDWPRSRRAA